MKLRRFRGATAAAAMAAVRRTLGEDALILETSAVEDGVEVLAATPGAEDAPAPLEVPPARGTDRERRLADLAWHGIGEALRPALLEDDLAHAITKTLRFGDLPVAMGDPPLLFAGEPGAGKTSAVIKVATRLVLRGVTPMIISTDGRRAGAVAQLAAMTELLGLTLIVADDPAHLGRALARRKDGLPVLVDAPGLAAGTPDDDALIGDIAGATGANILLVLQAGLDVAEATEIASAYAALGARRMLATRLDLGRRLGGIVEPAWRAGLVVTEAGIGPGAADGLVPLTASMIAERLRTRQGRVAPTTAPQGAMNPNESAPDLRPDRSRQNHDAFRTRPLARELG